nr:MAG TPA: hypothetical protein [Caudoviricetes sp.]
MRPRRYPYSKKKNSLKKQVLSSKNGEILFNLESGTFIIKK